MNVKNAINKLFRIGISIPYCFIKRVKRDGVDFFMTEACHIAENSQYQLAFRKIPKKYDDVPMLDYRTNISYAIVMQGPIRAEENFTLTTVKYYKRAFPQAHIIVSTWDDESKDIIEQIEKAGAYVVLNSKPDCTGTLMVNYQLVNSLGGIKKAAELGAEYIAKTRTDQKICRLHFLDYCKALLQNFPNQSDELKENGRIVDPRGKFGTYDIYGDFRYELAKLFHSVDGKYDFIIKDLFDLDYNSETACINYRIQNRKRDFNLYKVFLDTFSAEVGGELKKIELIEALLFLSMIPLHGESIRHQMVMLGTGLEILNRVIDIKETV